MKSSRREFLSSIAIAATALYTVPGAFAEELIATPQLTMGPFYPDRLPLDTDNDLLIISNSITPAVGTITHLSGRILDTGGSPIRNATIEIWQVDHNGVYIHSRSQNAANRDPNFQGFGRFETDSTGEYRFRTVKPVAYPGRTPHIHVLVKAPGRQQFISQVFIQGDPGNASDGVLNEIRDAKKREAVVVPFTPIAGSRIGEVAARFDVVY